MKEIINALEKLVGFITGIIIGILAILITWVTVIGSNIEKYYPNGLNGFLKDSTNNWKDWKIIDDNKSDKKSESEG